MYFSCFRGKKTFKRLQILSVCGVCVCVCVPHKWFIGNCWNHCRKTWHGECLRYENILCVNYIDHDLHSRSLPKGGWQFWCLSPVWNLRAVNLILLFYISSLVLLSSPVALTNCVSPWYNRHGWLGVKNQLSIYPVVVTVLSISTVGLFSWPLFP